MENLIINRRKQRKTNMKGITLIALVITIIVLLILAGVSIAMLTGNSGILTQANEGKEKSEIAEVKERVQTDIAAKQAENKNPILTERELNEILSKYGIVEDRNGKKVLVTKDGKYEILVEDIWAGILSKDYIVADGSWDGQVNTPKLTSDMSPVAWDDSNNEYIPKTNDEWFNYEEQRWANAKTKDGSYWVWIPRFEYKIIDTTGGDYTKAGEIKIRFISADTKKGTSGYTTIDGITKSDDEYIIHPVFTDGRDEGLSNGEWDSELSGFWISKYKMSQVDGTGNNIATVSSEKGNVGLSDNVKMVSKPGMSMWSNINVANCYTNSFKYDRNKESHLTKNSEWGALVYLTHSKFGRNGQEVTLNTTSYAGGGENEEYKS